MEDNQLIHLSHSPGFVTISTQQTALLALLSAGILRRGKNVYMKVIWAIYICVFLCIYIYMCVCVCGVVTMNTNLPLNLNLCCQKHKKKRLLMGNRAKNIEGCGKNNRDSERLKGAQNHYESRNEYEETLNDYKEAQSDYSWMQNN